MNREKKIIEVNLTFRYEGEKQEALREIQEEIEQGKCIVLCGGSGCGKSTMLRSINHLIPEFYEGELKGFCRIENRDTGKLSIGEVGEMAASVFQDPRSQFFTMNSSTEIAFGLENFGISHEEIVKKVDKAFEQFHLEKLKNRNVFELSSGERQLVAILAAWALDTPIFLMDEPTANLDFAAIEQLRELLKALKSRGKTMIINEHRLYYLNGIADEYWYMENGEIVQKFSEQAMGKLSETELSSLGLRATDLNLIKPVRKFEEEKAVYQNELSVKDIRFHYPRLQETVLDGISLTVHTGEVIGLVGSNGSGKTTLGKLMAGLLKPSDGKILYNGSIVEKKELITKSIFIMQEAEFQFFTNSVMKELEYGKKLTQELREEMEQWLRKFGMWECRNRHPFSLSGGQMQKLTLLLAYFSPKPIVILDEPTAGLDYRSLQSCIQIIDRMKKSKIVIMITHDLELISQTCSRCVCMEKGKIKREYNVKTQEGFCEMKEYMENKFSITDNQRKVKEQKQRRKCDPRIMLFYIAVSMVVAFIADMTLTIMTFLSLVVLGLYEKQYKVVLAGGIAYSTIFGLFYLFPNSMMYFIASYFPRILLIGVVVGIASGQDSAARMLAALRRLHVPEKIIMICAVVFRFFPVLSKDLQVMKQAIRTRGFFETTGEKLKALPEYLEILVVPMVFRTIRIAESLSASAETRGIDLKRKRESYISIQSRGAEAGLALLLICFVMIGLGI